MTVAANHSDPFLRRSTPETEEEAIRRRVWRIVRVLGADPGRDYFDDLAWEDGQPVLPTKRQLALYRAALCQRMTALLRDACPQAEIVVMLEPSNEYPESEIGCTDVWITEEEVWSAIFARDEDAWDGLHRHAFDDALAMAPRARRTRAG